MSATLVPLSNTRSALRHNPIGNVLASMHAPKGPRTSRQTQTRRTGNVLPTTKTQEGRQPVQQKRPHSHWLVSLGLGMVLMLLLVCAWQFVIPSATNVYNDWRYGQPRTFQIDAFVGHETVATIPSHFIALNLNGDIQVIELPGGDQSKVQRFQVTQLSGSAAASVPVTLQFVDPAHTHHPDMLVHIQDAQILLKNVNGTFKVVNN
ncbi:hypothetical protein [Dictyobacter formicarum]|uniref:Uncharacterized protein n=1 Tax=Dictyobacter formicarum TaxID=2778368 RepID=A0ABQ3VUE0_9CHLR|nr:hypothetical protein [Dictyobacter formicarum]GHO89314.1 hypothetical protein KSZ_73200 [Dictyobacter formicarum]